MPRNDYRCNVAYEHCIVYQRAKACGLIKHLTEDKK